MSGTGEVWERRSAVMVVFFHGRRLLFRGGERGRRRRVEGLEDKVAFATIGSVLSTRLRTIGTAGDFEEGWLEQKKKPNGSRVDSCFYRYDYFIFFYIKSFFLGRGRTAVAISIITCDGQEAGSFRTPHLAHVHHSLSVKLPHWWQSQPSGWSWACAWAACSSAISVWMLLDFLFFCELSLMKR